MAEQPDLFKKSYSEIEDEKYNKKYCLEYLSKGSSTLWDMRAWELDHSREEVLNWVRNGGPNNSGHSAFCVRRLKNMGVPEEEIVNAIMKNNKVTYKSRIVPCFLVECKKAKDNGGYSNGICDECCGDKKHDRKVNRTKASSKA